MFIARPINPRTCAPAERDVSGKGTRDQLAFRSSGASKALEIKRSIDITSPTGPGK